jgi:DNA-binding Lrp family transcriptional regulator
MSESSIRYVRDSLLERGIVKPVYHIDMLSLGYIDFTAFINRGAESSAGRAKIERLIAEYPQVTALYKMGGDWQYLVWLQIKNVFDIERFFSLIRPNEPGANFEKSIRLALEWTVFTPNYLAPRVSRRSSIAVSAKHNPVQIDETDEQILRGLAKHPEMSLTSLARHLRVNPTTLSYRYSKMQEKGVIRGLSYIIQIDKTQIQAYRILIVDRGLSLEQKKLLRKKFESCPNVVAAILCSGNWDYELRFETESYKDLERFSHDLYDTFGSAIDSIKTTQQLAILKRTSYPTQERSA